MRRFLLLLVCLVFCLALAAAATADEVRFEARCPASVQGGQSLSVPVKAYNWSCNAVAGPTLAMTALAGNAGNSLSGAGLYGPFKRTLAAWVIPAASCPQGWPTTPGMATRNILIVSPVNTQLNNKMAIATVQFIDSIGKPLDGDACFVNVVP
jgi:hypothetical protein